DDSIVEGPEDYTLTISAAGSPTGATVVLGAQTTVTTTITDNDTATWSLTGTTSITEGNDATYTVHLAGTLQSGETPTTNLALTDGSTTATDHADFVAAVNTAVAAYNLSATASGTLAYSGGVLTFTSDGTGTLPGTMSDLAITLNVPNDSLVEGPESYSVALT